MDNGSIAYLRAPVRLDFREAESFVPVARATVARVLVIDLAETKYIDSSGVWLLEEIARQTGAEAVVLQSASPALKAILTLARASANKLKFSEQG